MEAQTDIKSYLERGRQALAEGQPREAAIAYAHAAQIEPNNPLVHLGLAEANLGLGDYRVVMMACRRVQELQPNGGPESLLAQALLAVLDRRYDRALQDVDSYIAQEPGTAYAHALRAYLLNILGQQYDAGLARSRAARLSYGGRFENSFPPVEPGYATGYPPAQPPYGAPPVGAPRPPEQVPPWSRPNNMQRQVVRARFVASQHPRLITMTLIIINVIVYIIEALLSHGLSISGDVLITMGAQYNALVQEGQFWRIFTAMFLHFDIFHIGLNMLSLYFVGTATEIFFGKWRYAVIYLASGIVGGIATLLLSPANTLAAGASGAIFGIFGAVGAFYFMNRRALGGMGQGFIYNWLFWLILNLVWGFAVPGIGILDHIGGLVAGLVLGALLSRRVGPRRYV